MKELFSETVLSGPMMASVVEAEAEAEGKEEKEETIDIKGVWALKGYKDHGSKSSDR